MKENWGSSVSSNFEVFGCREVASCSYPLPPELQPFQGQTQATTPTLFGQQSEGSPSLGMRLLGLRRELLEY